jgi:hypothetical protein
VVEGRWELMKLVQGGCENLKSSSQVLEKILGDGVWGGSGDFGGRVLSAGRISRAGE